MYNFFFNTKIGYFLLLFSSSAALSIVETLLMWLSGVKGLDSFLCGALGANFIASLFYAITKRVFKHTK